MGRGSGGFINIEPCKKTSEVILWEFYLLSVN
jgi:hypothetical protein